ncbi:MAG: 4'-phosphopantetheinyl transferase superfamily protein [Terrimicrobiaceae bacterium]
MTPCQSAQPARDSLLSDIISRYACPLERGEIHVWFKAEESMPRGVRQPSAAAVAANRASQNVLLRLLANYSGVPAPSLKLRRAPFGKPYLEGGPHFNLSHSAGATAVAISHDEVGIDIEHPERRTSALELAKKYFTPSENAFLSKLPDSQMSRAFLRHWVSKEAITKLVGVGIYRGLRHAETGHGVTPSVASYLGRRVCLAECGVEVGMLGALATWQPAKVKVFVIGENSAMICGCHFKT